MSTNTICRRCGRELTSEDLVQRFCPVCGEPAESAPPEPEAVLPEEEPERAVLEWIVEDGYAVCPVCRASYYADAAPAQCERCAANPDYAAVRWEMPVQDAVLWLVHRGSGEQIACTDGRMLGRLHTGCLQDDLYVSRHHATVLIQDGHTLVRDEDSGNGTRVNGERLQPRKAHVLSPGDVLALDEQLFDVTRAGGEPS